MGGVNAFCERGYPAHNWAPLIPSMGRWIVIIPNKPVNYQYIQSYESRCYSGGMIRWFFYLLRAFVFCNRSLRCAWRGRLFGVCWIALLSGLCQFERAERVCEFLALV